MADKVKVKDKIKFIKKQIVFLPILLFSPIYFFNPSERLLILLTIVINFHIFCFMLPVYLLKYLIDKVDINQKFTDFLAVLSVIFMWGFTIFDWIKVFIMENFVKEFPTGIFIIPFISFVKVSLGILFLTFLYKIYTFCNRSNEG